MTVVVNRSGVFTLLHAPYGTTGRYTFMRGERVAARAKALLAGKVRTGRLQNSIKASPPERYAGRKRGLTVRVGAGRVRYARWVHDGTGIYGKYGSRIVPRRSTYLRFMWHGRVVYAKSVRGVPAFPYLRRALAMEMGR